MKTLISSIAMVPLDPKFLYWYIVTNGCCQHRNFSGIVFVWHRILNQTLFTPEFLKEAFWGLSFFSTSLMMCIVPSIIVRLSPMPTDTVMSMVLPSTPLHAISTSACIWIRHLILKRIFTKFTRRQQEEWTFYGASVPALILLVPNEFTSRWLCQYSRIAAIIVLVGRSPVNDDPLHWETKPRNHFLEMQSAVH